MTKRDAKTESMFNGRVTFQCADPDLDYRINGRKITETLAAQLTGAPDGAQISLSIDDNVSAVFAVNHQIFMHESEWEVQIYDTGLIMSIKRFVNLREEHQRQGIGLRMFAIEAKTARELGIGKILLWAEGSSSNPLYNGYYSWACYGFDADLTADEIESLPLSLRRARCVKDLMASDAGRNWWQEFGTARIMEFVLTSDDCWNALESYLCRKGISI